MLLTGGGQTKTYAFCFSVILVGHKASTQTTHRLANQSHTQVNDAGVDNLSALEIIVRSDVAVEECGEL